MENVKRTIQFLTKGCSCKKGCVSNNCGCRKKKVHCGPGCECQGCVNLPVDEVCELDDSSDASGNESGSKSNENTEEDAEELQMEIITDDFYTDTIDIV